MRYICSLLFSLFISALAMAQQPAKTTAEYNGQKYPCYAIEFNLPPDEAEKVVKERMKTDGYHSNKSKGFLVYRNIKLNELDLNDHLDVLFKIERKSRKEKDQSIVTMIAAKAGEIPSEKVKGAKIVADIKTPGNSVEFLNGFQSKVDLAVYNLEVEKQVNEVAKAEKSLEKLQKTQAKIEKKIKELESGLTKNKKDQGIQTEEIEKQKKLLEEKKNVPPVE